MPIAAAAAMSLLCGFLLTATVLPSSNQGYSSWLMKLSLSAGLGLGISSCAFLVARMIGGDHFLIVDVLVLAALFVLYFQLRSRFVTDFSVLVPSPDFAAPVWLHRVLPAFFVISIVAALYRATVDMVSHEYGDGWDAFAIWNLHARFLFFSGPHWRDGFNALIPWSHPDYPLLLPAAIARFWSYSGYHSTYVPAFVGIVFSACTVTLLASSLARLRGRNAAVLAGLTLLSTPFFVEQATAQYADVPLSFFILASIVLLHFGARNRKQNNLRYMQGPWLLAGVSAGLAAWTKNEGLLFLAAIFLAALWIMLPRANSQRISENLADHRWELFPSLLVGTIPVLAVILWFKHSLATAGDLFSTPAVMLQKLLTPSRYVAILRWYGKELLRFGEWWPVPGTILLMLFYFLVREKRTRDDPFFRSSTAVLALTLAGYFAIYLITPRDLYWHLRFSLNRLFLQLWPATLFLFFLFVGRQSPAASQIEPENP